MNVAAKAIRVIGVSAALSVALVHAADAACSNVVQKTIVRPAVVTRQVVRPVAQARVVETVVDTDVVYSPIRNEVVTKLPVRPAVAAPIDTLKLQIMNGINTGIATGKLTEVEAERLQGMLDALALEEAQFKLAGLNDGMINNLMRKYHMIDQYRNELSNNTATNDFMFPVENRRDMLARRIAWHLTSGNLTPGEHEQLLVALNTISDNYATYRATGGVLTADELEAVHKDLFNLHKKLIAKVSGTIAVVVPETHVARSEYLKKIQQGLACKTISAEEGACLIKQYNRLVLLEQTIAAHEGVRSPEMKLLAEEIDNLNFILTRELRDRTVAGESARF